MEARAAEQHRLMEVPPPRRMEVQPGPPMEAPPLEPVRTVHLRRQRMEVLGPPTGVQADMVVEGMEVEAEVMEGTEAVDMVAAPSFRSASRRNGRKRIPCKNCVPFTICWVALV
jgi:hypothetical protein